LIECVREIELVHVCVHACMRLDTSGCCAVWGESFPFVSNDHVVSCSGSNSTRHP